MAVTPSPTVRRKRLGTELRRLREQARLTCESVGQRLDCSGTRISRIETGRISVRPGDVRELLEVYGVTGDQADALAELAREARRKGWWHRFGPVTPSWLEPYLGLEAEAAGLRDFQSMVLPGLVQTEDYTRAILRAAPGAGPAEDIEQQVALRMERQAVLDGSVPPELRLVLSEAALRVQVGGPEVMRAQLRKLAEVAGRGQVTLQVLPAGAAAHVQAVSPFTILDFADPADPPVVYTEHLTGSLVLDDPGEVRAYTAVFERLRAEALDPGPSLDLIAASAS
jgi:transcriptional regulator with XRE-family HTH domain